jgi:hypothetical protein
MTTHPPTHTHTHTHTHTQILNCFHGTTFMILLDYRGMITLMHTSDLSIYMYTETNHKKYNFDSYMYNTSKPHRNY